ncbi:MAG: hypothetical protein ABI440_05075 [Casimicrobiaceae bacterium]
MPAIPVIQKARQTIIASLHQSLRNTGEIEAWKSAHEPTGSRIALLASISVNEVSPSSLKLLAVRKCS